MAAAFVTLVAWSVLVPAWESPDEPQHWQYANFVHDHGQLPPYTSEFIEGNEPPVYYFLMSPFAVDAAVPAQSLGTALGPDGRRHYNNLPRLYPTSPHDLRDFAGLHLARIATCLVSLVTVWCTFLAGRALTGRRDTGLLACGLVAFLPEFSGRASAFSADAMVAAVASVATWLTIRMWRDGFSARSGAVIGLVIGVATLSKITGVAVVAGFACAAVFGRPPASPARRLMRLWPLGLALVIALPWLLHNQLTYGDPLAVRQSLIAVSDLVDRRPLFSYSFFVLFPLTLAESFVGLFGWTNVHMPAWYWLLYTLLLSTILAGLVRLLRLHTRERLMVLALLATFGAALAATLVVNLTFFTPQGRYLFPALPAIAVVSAMALEATPGWLPRARRATLAVVTGLGVLDVALLPLVIVPAYGVHW